MASKLFVFMVCAIVVVISVSMCDAWGAGCGKGRDPYTGEEYGSYGRRCWGGEMTECCVRIGLRCGRPECLQSSDCDGNRSKVTESYCLHYDYRWQTCAYNGRCFNRLDFMIRNPRYPK